MKGGGSGVGDTVAPRPAPVSEFTSQRPEPHSISKRLPRNPGGELIIFATRDHFSVEIFTVSPPMTLAIGRTSADPAGRGERGRFRRRHRNRLPGCAAHTRSGLALEGDGQTDRGCRQSRAIAPSKMLCA